MGTPRTQWAKIKVHNMHDLSKYTVPTKVVGMLVVSDLSTKVVGIQASKQIQ